MHHKSGFTLLEMLIVLTIAGILLGIASPSLLAYQTSTQMREVNNAVAQTLQDASSSAMRSNTAYTVVFSLNSADGSDLTASGGVALSPSEVVFTARGWPNLSAPIVISTQIRNRVGTIKLLLTGKAVIQ
jgi:type IV fimbrial biogenesis protein FimT